MHPLYLLQLRLRQVNRTPLQVTDDVNNASVVIAQLQMLGTYRVQMEGVTGEAVGCGDIAAIGRLVDVFYAIVNNRPRISTTLPGRSLYTNWFLNL